MSRFYSFLILGGLLFLFSCKKQTTPERPNILIILTDDQGYGDLSIHGNQWLQTPHLDRLAKESARFDRFYVSPLCAPTRASLLTGRYHLRTGVVSVSKGLETMNAAEYTLAELLLDQGYRTGIFGKWHNGQHHPNHPLSQGFEEFTGFSAGHWSNYFDPKLEKNGQNVRFEGYLPDILTNEAMDFIRKDDSKPFFAYVSLNTPHSPHQVPDRYFQKFKEMGLDDELASVYGMVSNLDENVGRMMNLLEELELDENTLVVFLTDNGPNGKRFNGAMKGIKGSVHEGGIRVPSFWRWLGKISPRIISTPAAHIDVLPTISDFLGLDPSSTAERDGVSLVPLMNGQSIESRAIFTHVAQLDSVLKDRPGAIRKDSFLLALLPTGLELYDLKNDPEQLTDLSLVLPSVVNSLSEDYQNWWKTVSSGINMSRKIPVSSRFSEVVLYGYESRLYGELAFFEGHGWAQDWVKNWKKESDSLVWALEVIDPGVYEVWLEYTADQSQVGSTILLKTTQSTLTSMLSVPFNPSVISSPDRLLRKEAPEQTWGKIRLGEVTLRQGQDRFVLSAKDIKPAGAFELFSLRLIPSKKENQ